MRTSPQLEITVRARASDLDRARSRASELTRALANAHSSALAFGHVEVLNQDRVLDRASAVALDITPSGTLDLDRAHSRASDLVCVLDRALSRACGLEGTIKQVRELAAELTGELTNARTLYDDNFRATVLTYERTRVWRAERDLSHARDLTRDLERARDLTRDLARDLTRATTTEQHGAEQVVPLAGHLLSAVPRCYPQVTELGTQRSSSRNSRRSLALGHPVARSWPMPPAR